MLVNSDPVKNKKKCYFGNTLFYKNSVIKRILLDNFFEFYKVFCPVKLIDGNAILIEINIATKTVNIYSPLMVSLSISLI
jgi:hypothetical protein